MNVIMEYDDFVIFKTDNDKYFVVDWLDKYCGLVELKEKMFMGEWEAAHDKDFEVIDFYCDYSGQSDDFEWALGFDRIKNKEN